MNLCDDNRTATIEAAKMAMIKGTNIEDSPEEMKVLNSFLLRCWQMGWLDRYAPPRHFNAMPKVISERLAAGHGSNVPMQPNIPPMPSNTSNALKALDSVNATQSNALDSISRQAALGIAFKYCPDDDGTCSEAGTDLRDMIDELENLPPAQPEIIRCKDCKYYNSEEKECLDLLGHGRRWEEYDFCSYAERKQNDTERC